MSVEVAFGVNYKIPDEGNNQGKIATLDGVLEMGYYFANSSAWYVNIGKDMPENRRIQARSPDRLRRLFLPDAVEPGIRAGAGASYSLKKKWGPLKAEFAYLDVSARSAAGPSRSAGRSSLAVRSSSIFGCGFGLCGDGLAGRRRCAALHIAGSLKVCVKILWKKYCGTFDFNWTFDPSLNLEEILDPAGRPGAGRQGAQHAHRRNLPAVDRNRAAGRRRARRRDGADGQLHRPRIRQGVKVPAGVNREVRRHCRSSKFVRVPAMAPKAIGALRIQASSIEILYHNGGGWVPTTSYAAATPLDSGPLRYHRSLHPPGLGY